MLQKTLTLIAGTSAGQIILLLATPILSRVYSPSDFGQFAMLLAMVALVAPFSTLRYETAILIKEESHPPKSLLILSFSILFAFATLMLIIASPINLILPELSVKKELPFLFALFVFMEGMNLILVSWHSRFQRFSTISFGRLLQAIGIVGGQITLGSTYGPFGLIYGYLIGISLNGAQLLMVLILRDGKNVCSQFSFDHIILAARIHKKFPLWLTWSSFLNGMVNQMPNLLFGKLFSASVAGNYMMATRLLRAPLSLIGQSIYQVMAQYAGMNVDKREEVVSTLQKVIWSMANFSIVPFVLLSIILPSGVEFILGEKWIDSGLYALVLLPWLFTIFISWPLTGIFNSFGYQRNLLLFNVLFFAVIVFGFLGATLGANVFVVLVILSALGSVARVFYSVWIVAQLDKHMSIRVGRLLSVYVIIIGTVSVISFSMQATVGVG